MKVKSTLKLMAVVMVAILPSQLFAGSEPDDNAAKIKHLEAMVSALAQRVSALEKLTGQNSAIAEGVHPQADWKKKENWSSLQTGMSKAQVKALLGEPDKINVNAHLEYWKWTGPIGSSVTFYNEKLYGWQAPE